MELQLYVGKMLRYKPKGYIYNNENIGAMLEQRHLNQRIRRGGGRIQSSKKRTKEDDMRLYKNLIYLIDNGNLE